MVCSDWGRVSSFHVTFPPPPNVFTWELALGSAYALGSEPQTETGETTVHSSPTCHQATVLSHDLPPRDLCQEMQGTEHGGTCKNRQLYQGATSFPKAAIGSSPYETKSDSFKL